jgi:hypothetical protein
VRRGVEATNEGWLILLLLRCFQLKVGPAHTINAGGVIDKVWARQCLGMGNSATTRLFRNVLDMNRGTRDKAKGAMS